jgi:glycosyltransferase involved in cell wall biosynthesis
MENVRADLSELYGVVLQEGVLSDRDYGEALANSDAILLPYHTDYYRARGSGILTEALSCGRIVLGSAHTVVEEYREEGVVFPCSTPEDWGSAAMAIVADGAAMRQASERKGVIFRSRFAARSLIDRLAFRVLLT